MKKIKHVVLGILIFIGILILDQIPMLALVIFKGIKISERISTILIVISVVIVCFIVIRFGIRQGYFDSEEKFWTPKNVGVAVLMFIMTKVFAVLMSPLLVNETTANNDAIVEILAGTSYLSMFVVLCVLAPIVEEILCRGFITNYFFRDENNQVKSVGFEALALIVSSSVFSFLHGSSDIWTFLLYFSMGACFAVAYYWTKRIEVGMLAHFLNNFLSLIVLIGMGAF